MHNFVVHLNEGVCRKSGRLGLDQVIVENFASFVDQRLYLPQRNSYCRKRPRTHKLFQI